jgi:hypothetical protein
MTDHLHHRRAASRHSVPMKMHLSPALKSLVDRAAAARGCSVSQWTRDAFATALALAGIDPVAEDAGALYDSQDGQARYALVKDGQIIHMGYHDAKPEGWIPVVHEDSEPFDPARHWRLKPYFNIVDHGGTPVRVICSFPVVLKSREHA